MFLLQPFGASPPSDVGGSLWLTLNHEPIFTCKGCIRKVAHKGSPKLRTILETGLGKSAELGVLWMLGFWIKTVCVVNVKAAKDHDQIRGFLGSSLRVSQSQIVLRWEYSEYSKWRNEPIAVLHPDISSVVPSRDAAIVFQGDGGPEHKNILIVTCREYQGTCRAVGKKQFELPGIVSPRKYTGRRIRKQVRVVDHERLLR